MKRQRSSIHKGYHHPIFTTISGREKEIFFRHLIYERDKGICQICQSRVEFEEMEIDHIIPRTSDGPTLWNNLQISHKVCNLRKGGKKHPKLTVPKPLDSNIDRVTIRLPKELHQAYHKEASETFSHPHDLMRKALRNYIDHLGEKNVK
jgi:HNH endonuclease